MFPFIAASAVVPSLLLIWYFRARDLNPEPAPVLWATFGLGVGTVIPVLVVATPVSKLFIEPLGDPLLRGALDAVFAAAVPEEFFKWLVVVFYCSRHREFDEPMDGLVYGAVASLGFATFENVLYVSESGVGVALLRAFSAVPGHAFMGAIMGWYVARAKFGPAEARPGLLLRSYLVPMTLHALYDAPLLILKNVGKGAGLLGFLVLVTLGVLLYEWRWTLRLVRGLHAAQESVAASHLFAPPLAFRPVTPPPVPTTSRWAPPARVDSGPSVFSLFLVLGGAIMASVGGLLTFAVFVGLAVGQTAPEDLPAAALGTLLFGVTPLVAGLLMFRSGLRRLHPAPRPALA